MSATGETDKCGCSGGRLVCHRGRASRRPERTVEGLSGPGFSTPLVCSLRFIRRAGRPGSRAGRMPAATRQRVRELTTKFPLPYSGMIPGGCCSGGRLVCHRGRASRRPERTVEGLSGPGFSTQLVYSLRFIRRAGRPGSTAGRMPAATRQRTRELMAKFPLPYGFGGGATMC